MPLRAWFNYVPQGTGPLGFIAAFVPLLDPDWDCDGTGTYPTAGELRDAKSAKVTVTASHTYTKPGTYFAAIRATSHRQGDARTPYERVQNLGRVRVVVK